MAKLLLYYSIVLCVLITVVMFTLYRAAKLNFPPFPSPSVSVFLSLFLLFVCAKAATAFSAS